MSYRYLLFPAREIPTSFSGHSFVNPAIQQATNQVDSAINQTIKNLFSKNRTHSVQDLITIFRYPSADALQLARAEEIFEQTLEIIRRHVNDGHKYNLTSKGKWWIRLEKGSGMNGRVFSCQI